jgi:hypothetical protein
MQSFIPLHLPPFGKNKENENISEYLINCQGVGWGEGGVWGRGLLPVVGFPLIIVNFNFPLIMA